MIRFVCMVLITYLLAVPSVYSDIFKVHCRERPPEMDFELGQCVGVIPEFVNLVLGNIGHQAKWIKVPWVRSLKEAEYGRVDLLVRHSMTRERAKFLFAIPYGYEKREIFYVISPKKRFKIRSLEDLYGLKLGFLRGSYYSKEFSYNSDLDKESFSSHEQLIRMLNAGRIDAAPTSQSHNQLEYLSIPGVRRSNYTEKVYNMRYISIPKKSPMSKYHSELEREVNKVIITEEFTRLFEDRGVSPPIQNID